MGLFDGLSTPRWLTPTDEANASAEVAIQLGHNFSSSMEKQKDRDFEQSIFDQKLAAAQTEKQQQMDKLSQIAPALVGASTPEQAWDVVSKNPEWLVDPQTAPLVSGYLKTQSQVATAQTKTLQGQMDMKDGTEFMKRLGGIDPADRAAIKAMTPNKDGGPSAMQWQAVSLAEKTVQAQKDNVAKQAEVEALARGDVPTTTVGPKGVTTTFRPGKVGDVGAEPQTKQLKDGTTLAWMPNGKTIHVIRPNGDKKELTPNQLLSIGKALQEQGDPDAANMIQAAKTGAMKQMPDKATPEQSAPALAPASASPVQVSTKAERDKLPAGTKYIGPDGATYIKQ